MAKNREFSIHLHSTFPLGGRYRNLAIPFDREKLEWCGYPTVRLEKFVDTVEYRGMTDRQTDRHGRTSCDCIDRAVHTHRAVKIQ